MQTPTKQPLINRNTKTPKQPNQKTTLPAPEKQQQMTNKPQTNTPQADTSFYLGTNKADGTQVTLPTTAFHRHFMALGSSGSGKTVLCKCIIEEAVRNNIPAIIIDPQGDISSLTIKADPTQLEKHGTPINIQQEYFQKARTTIFTPASNKAIPISINPFRSPEQDIPHEEAVQALDMTATALTSYLDYDPKSNTGKAAKALIFTILEHQWRKNQKTNDINHLAQTILNPPAEIAPTLNSLTTKKETEEIARKLRLLTIGTSALLFQTGIQIDINQLLDRTDGKIPVNIIYLNTLTSENDKQFFVATLLKELYCWMLKNPSTNLSMLFYIDEIAPYIPPYPRNPPPKNAYTLLFKQARKYGIGLIAATQNITDIDYKALAQVNTWCLGRMMTTQDITRVQKILQSIDPTHANTAIQKLPSLRTGEFLLLSPDYYNDIIDFQVRWLATEHQTLDERNLAQYITAESRTLFQKQTEEPPAETKTKEEHETAARTAPLATTTEENVQNLLFSARKAIPADSIAQSLNISPADTEKALQKLVKAKIAKKGQAKHNRQNLYWLTEFKLDPSKDITGEVLTIPASITQIEASKKANSMLKGGAFRKEEQIYEAEFRYLPIWRITGTRKTTKLLLLKKEEARTYYVSSQTAAIVALQKGQITFHKLMTNATEKPRNLDEDRRITFEPKLPSEIPTFPNIKTDKDTAYRTLEQKIGIKPTSAEIVLLPVWTLKIQHKTKKTKRTIHIDAATGRLLTGDF